MIPYADAVWQDIRLATRSLRRQPALVMLSVAALALGIGATTAVYRFGAAVLSRPLPVADPHAVVAILYGTDGVLYRTHPYPDALYYRDHSRTLAHIAVIASGEVLTATDDRLESAVCEFVSPEYFSLLGVRPSAGRLTLEPATGTSNPDLPAVVSELFARRHFGSGANALGRTIKINRRFVTIVGTTGFEGLQMESRPDAWLPLSSFADVHDLGPDERAALFGGRSNESFYLIGRLAPGRTASDAQAEIRHLHSQLNNGARRWWAKGDSDVRVVPINEAQLLPQERGPVVDFMSILAVGTLLLLAIAALNGSGVMLVRFLGRTGEIAARLALGAPRWVVTRGLMLETLLVTCIGAALGVVLSHWCVKWFHQVLQGSTLSASAPAAVEWQTLAVAFGIAIVLGVALGAAPALRVSSVDLVTALKQGRTGRTARASRLTLGELFLACQIAISVVLLVGSVLLVMSVRRALSVELGFANRDLHVFAIELPPAAMSRADAARVYLSMLERVRSLPLVRSTAAAAVVPLGRRKFIRQVHVAGSGTVESVDGNAVSDQYFETLGIRVVQGRSLGATDTEDRPLAAVVNETFARRHWPNGNGLGQSFQIVVPKGSPLTLDIVGIAADGKYREIGEAARPFFYVSLRQFGSYGNLNLLVRPHGSPTAATAAAVQKEIQRVAPATRISSVTDLAADIDNKLLKPRVASQLMLFGAAVALAVTLIGLSSAMAYAVRQRRQEIAIRLALGATPRSVVLMMCRTGTRVIGLGLFLGYSLTFLVGRFTAALLFAVEPGEPMTLIVVGAIAASTCAVACFLPARSAAQVEPVPLLKSE